MNSLQRANALFEKGQKTFERAYSKETLNLNEVDKAIKLFKESLIIYEAVYGEDFASRAHVEINTILLVLINRASANDDNSSLSDINRCSELLRKALLTALPELVEHYYDASLEMLDFYRKSKNSVFYTYAVLLSELVTSAAWDYNLKPKEIEIRYWAICLNYGLNFKEGEKDHEDLGMLTMSIRYLEQAIRHMPQSEKEDRRILIFDLIGNYFYVCLLNDDNDALIQQREYINQLLQITDLPIDWRIAALSYLAESLFQSSKFLENSASIEQAYQCFDLITSFVMRTTFSELELFRLGYSRILKVYTMFNDSRALQLGIDMINGLASRVGLDEGSNELALLSVQRGELLHNLYISNHQLETLLDAIQTITQGIKMFPDNDERRLDAILLLRHFLRSYEERGGDVFSLDTSILTIAFGPEAERYSSINFAKRLYERIGANHGSYEIYEKWTGVLTRQEWETYQTLDSDQLESAIDQLADRLRSLQPNSQDYATTLFKLARAADVKYQRTWRYEDLISTLSLYEESLKLATPEQYIQQFLLIALSYGQLLYSRGQLSRAQDLFDQARNASLKLHGFVSQELQENASSQRDDRYPHIIAQLISDGKLVDAYEYILIAKQPFIKDVPLGVLLDLSGLGLEQSQIAKDIEDIRLVQKNLGEVLEQINSASLTANILATLRNQLVELHSREKQIINDLTKRSYSGLRRLERHAETKYEEIQKMVTSLGIKAIEYYEHADGWGAFILDGTNIRYVPLPNLGADILSNMHQWLKDLEYVSKRSIQSTETLLTEWHSAMFAPLETYCIVGEKLAIAGYNELHYLPMHIAFSPVRQHYLLEDFSISFVDSMSHLNFISQHIQNNDSYSIPKKALLSVAVPGSPSSPLFLGSAKPESDSLAAIFPSSYQLQDNEATIDQVLFYAKTSSLIHFACHGYSSIEQPTNSGLVLADGILNVDAIQNSVHWFSKKLVILASCRSGQANIINPMPLDWLASNRWRKDLLGISRAFLSSGVDCVLSAMWDASDTITKKLIERFCLQIRQGISPSEALQFAVKDIRSDPRYSLLEHPFYWAGFQVQGLGMLTIKSLDMLKEPGKHEEERGYDQQQGLELFEHMGDQIRRADDLYNQGASASSRGKYEEARSYYQRSLELFGLLGNRSVRADIWYNLGTTAYRQKKYEEARGYYQQSLALFEQLKDEHGRASALQALGKIALTQEKYEEARSYYQQSLQLFEQLQDDRMRADTLKDLGIVSTKLKEYEEARNYYQQSLTLFEQLGIVRERASALQDLGNLADLQGMYKEARNFYQQSLEIRERLVLLC